MKSRRPALPGAAKAIGAIAAGPFLVAALCLAGALAAFLVYPAYAQSSNEASAPSNLTAAIADGGVILNWSSPTEDTASVTGYEVLRRRPKEGEGALLVLVADTGSTATTYVDATANEPGTRYVYRVKALRGGEKSSRSNYARVDLPEEADETGPTPAPAPRDGAQAEACPDPAPTPTAVDATAVPIVVESTTADYFVLYVSHDVDGTEVEIPVLVKRGEAGTTILAENVEALPAERYRVEKYLIADPADVDGDCIDDITELGDLGSMNPVNPAAAIELSDGAVVILDTQTYDALAVGGYLKFGLVGMDTDRPSFYFINTKTHPTHQTFLDDRSINRQRVILGAILYRQNLVAPDGSQGVYLYSFNTLPYRHSFSLMERTHTLLAASMPLLEDNLALYVRNRQLPDIQADLPLYRESRINLVFDGDSYSGIDFLALNPGVGYGRLQVLDPDGRPHPRNIVIYEALPNELPRVAGIITTVPQTPLSHVNLRAVQDGIPNAYIRDIRDDPAVAPLIGSYVRYEVTEDGYSIRAATKEEVDAHYEASRPQPQTPERDLSVTEITPLSEIGFDDWRTFGVKAANVAVLGTLDFPEGAVPEGFAIPFHFYDEFMKANGFLWRHYGYAGRRGLPDGLRRPRRHARRSARRHQGRGHAPVNHRRADRHARRVSRRAIAALPVEHEQRRPAGVQRGGVVRLQDAGPGGDRSGRDRQVAEGGVCQSVDFPRLHGTGVPPDRSLGGDDGRAGASQLQRRVGQRRRCQLRPHLRLGGDLLREQSAWRGPGHQPRSPLGTRGGPAVAQGRVHRPCHLQSGGPRPAADERRPTRAARPASHHDS